MKIFSIVQYQLKCCPVADDATPDCHMVWSGAACCQQGHRWVAWTACVRADGQHFKHLLWAANFSFWLTLLFNFAKTVFGMLSKVLLGLQGSIQLQHTSQVWHAEWHKSSLTKLFWHVPAKNYQIRMPSGKLVAHSKRATFKTQCKHR